MYEENLRFSRVVDAMVYKDTTMKWAHTSRKALFLVGFFSSFVFVFQGVRAAGIIPSDVVSFANEARISVGLRALTPNSVLAQAAEYKARDMIEHDYFAHTSPTGVEPWFWFQKAGYQYKAAGENLAINYTDVREQHTAWMQSETHRANILGEQYQEIGVAVVSGIIDGKDSLITVEFFGTPFVHVADQVSMRATEELVAALPLEVGQQLVAWSQDALPFVLMLLYVTLLISAFLILARVYRRLWPLDIEKHQDEPYFHMNQGHSHFPSR